MNLQTNLAFLFSSSTLFSHISLLQSIYYVVGLKKFLFWINSLHLFLDKKSIYRHVWTKWLGQGALYPAHSLRFQPLGSSSEV